MKVFLIILFFEVAAFVGGFFLGSFMTIHTYEKGEMSELP